MSWLSPLSTPPVIGAATAALVYWRGNAAPLRVTAGRAEVLRQRRARGLAFAAGLLVIVLALSAPVDRASDHYFWVHMTQHLLLVMVAAPLIVLGAPWVAPWRLLGHRIRLGLTRRVGHSTAWAGRRRVWRFLVAPIPAWVIFNTTLLGWHLPVLYNLTLRNVTVHYTEHALLLLTSMLFWTQVIDSPPLARRLAEPQRVAYLTLATVAGWLLALAIVLPATPIYAAYAVQHAATSGMSALTDQQLAAGMMWVPGSIPYSIGVLYAIYRWLDEDPPVAGPLALRTALRKGHST